MKLAVNACRQTAYSYCLGDELFYTQIDRQTIDEYYTNVQGSPEK